MSAQKKTAAGRGATPDQDYLEETRAFWQERTARPLSREDARELAHNLVGFFSVLREWSLAEAAGSDAALPPCPAPGSPKVDTSLD